MKSAIRFKLIFIFIKTNYIPVIICFFYLTSYLILSINKHLSFQSGYDLSIIDQAIWKYSQLKIPITTTQVYFDTPIYVDHLELIFLLIAPLYWIVDNVVSLIVLQVFSVVVSGIAIYLLAKKYCLNNFLSNVILISYLSFYGIQFAIWSDVHSLVFGVFFLSWFLFFLDSNKLKLTLLFLVLAVISKEDIAFLLLAISVCHFILNKNKLAIYTSIIAISYLLVVFLFYFPNVVPGGYRYANPNGILNDLNLYNFINTSDKQKAIIYSLGWFGFIPLFLPILLLPFLADLFHYFVLGNTVVSSAQGLFMHYRSSIALLLSWPTIIIVSKINKKYSTIIGIYLLFCVAFFQYYLHLPLSYLTKKWFWIQPPEVKNINKALKYLPKNASVATQNNIAVHISHRDEVYTLFPNTKEFKTSPPCASKTCKWFRVGGNPEYLLIDTGGTWNILHYLANREDFLNGISNLEKNGNISVLKEIGTTKLYTINKKI